MGRALLETFVSLIWVAAVLAAVEWLTGIKPDLTAAVAGAALYRACYAARARPSTPEARNG